MLLETSTWPDNVIDKRGHIVAGALAPPATYDPKRRYELFAERETTHMQPPAPPVGECGSLPECNSHSRMRHAADEVFRHDACGMDLKTGPVYSGQEGCRVLNTWTVECLHPAGRNGH